MRSYIGNIRGAKGDRGLTGPPGGFVFPLSEWNNAFAGSFHPDSASGSTSTMKLFFARIFIPAGKAITKVGTYVTVASPFPSAQDCQLVFEANGVLAGETPGDASLLASIGWRWGNLLVPIPASSVDRFVWVSHYAEDASSLSQAFVSHTAAAGLTTTARAIYDSPVSKPTTYNFSTNGTRSDQFIPLILVG